MLEEFNAVTDVRIKGSECFTDVRLKVTQGFRVFGVSPFRDPGLAPDAVAWTTEFTLKALSTGILRNSGRARKRVGLVEPQTLNQQ